MKYPEVYTNKGNNLEKKTKELEDIGLEMDSPELKKMDIEYQQVIFELGDQNLFQFRTTYEKMYRELKQSIKNEHRLLNKCKELNDIILTNTSRIKAALIMSKEDANTIRTLQSELDKAWKLIEQAKDKEDQAKKMIQNLRSEIAQLNKVEDQESGLSVGSENTVHELMRSKEELKKQLANSNEEIEKLNLQIESTLDEVRKVNKDLLNEKANNGMLLKEKSALEEEIKNKDNEISTANDQHEIIKKNFQDSEKKRSILEENAKKQNNEYEALNMNLKEMELKNNFFMEKIKEIEIENQKKDEIIEKEKCKSEGYFKKIQELTNENCIEIKKVSNLENTLSKFGKEDLIIKPNEGILQNHKDEEEDNKKKLVIQTISNLESEVEQIKK